VKSWSLAEQLQVQWRTRISPLDLRSASHRARSPFCLFCSYRHGPDPALSKFGLSVCRLLTVSWPVSTCRPILLTPFFLALKTSLTIAMQLSLRVCLLIYVPAQSCGVMIFASNPGLIQPFNVSRRIFHVLFRKFACWGFFPGPQNKGLHMLGTRVPGTDAPSCSSCKASRSSKLHAISHDFGAFSRVRRSILGVSKTQSIKIRARFPSLHSMLLSSTLWEFRRNPWC
jgi:hypothetical protein